MPMDLEAGAGKLYPRLVIRDAHIVSGRGTPPEGPVDIVVEQGVIASISRVDAVSLNRYPKDWQRPQGDCVIDAKGMYVLPGLIDSHVHVPATPGASPPFDWEYAYRLWLGHGVTSIRTMGGSEPAIYQHRALAAQRPELPIPRLVVNHRFPREGHMTEAQIRAQVGTCQQLGADGIKMFGCEPSVLETVCDEANRLGMKAGVAIHLGLDGEADAVMASNAGVRSIEHTYGIPEAAIPGVQNFPQDYNEMDELLRFRQSGCNWIEADRYPDRVLDVLDIMITNQTVWSPTMVVYEPNRDIMRAQHQAWFDEYTTPAMLKFWAPTPGVHASFHFDWRTSDDVAWKQKYQIWMKYLRTFFEEGGTIVAGADAGYLYTLYGFSLIRELEMLQEAGFHGLDIIKMATTNSAALLGLDEQVRGVQVGAPADLAIVDGNPIGNFKLMYGMGMERYLEDRVTKVKGGGVRWTIRGGAVFDARGIMEEIKQYVKQQKAAVR